MRPGPPRAQQRQQRPQQGGQHGQANARNLLPPPPPPPQQQQQVLESVVGPQAPVPPVPQVINPLILMNFVRRKRNHLYSLGTLKILNWEREKVWYKKPLNSDIFTVV